MADVLATYRTSVSGFWSTRHTLYQLPAPGRNASEPAPGAPGAPGAAAASASPVAGSKSAPPTVETLLGVLSIERRASGTIGGAVYRPVKGEVLHFRRDPGILRSQFSLWTDGNEWLGSSLRWSFTRREIAVSTGNKPYRLLPLPSFGRGWRMVAPKTGELARMRPRFGGRAGTITVYRKIDFELLLFAYFLGSQVWTESFWPAHAPEDESEGLTTPSKA